jgi:predicted dehydrogenase
MNDKKDGMNYAPVSIGKKILGVKDGEEFYFSVIGLDHGHIFGMTNGLLEAGAKLFKVYDSDRKKAEYFISRYPQAKCANSQEEVLADKNVSMIVSAIKPCQRAELGIKAMLSGKDFFADKPGMLKLSDIDEVSKVCKSTNRRFFIYFSERIHVEGAMYAQKLIQEGAIGRVLHLTILAPHRLNPETRPAWFFDITKNGGVLNDIGSHQIEQFLTFSGAKTARITHSTLANYNNPKYPGFFDYGDCHLIADNGVSGFFRIDWFTPAGLRAWGDGRVFIIGTEGYIEVRKYVNVAVSEKGDTVFLVNKNEEKMIEAGGLLGFEFFAAIIRDCIDKTQNAMTQEHIFETTKLAIMAQEQAEIIHPS